MRVFAALALVALLVVPAGDARWVGAPHAAVAAQPFAITFDPGAVQAQSAGNVTPVKLNISNPVIGPMLITITTNASFSIHNATVPTGFVARPTSTSAPQTQLQIVGVRPSAVGNLTIFLNLTAAADVPEGAYPFVAQVCTPLAGPTGCNGDPDDLIPLLVDATPPTFTAINATGETGILDLARGVATLAWTTGADVDRWYVSTTPPPADRALWQAPKPANVALGAPSDGPRTLYFGVMDAAGNYAVRERTIVRDQTPPLVTPDPEPTLGWDGAIRTVTLRSPDAVSISAWIDTGAPTSGAPPLVAPALTEGTHTIHFTGTDRAGNTGAVVNRTYKTDLTPPTVTITVPSHGLWWNTTPRVAVAATDALSGASTLEYRVNGVGWIALPSTSGAFDLTQEGHDITVEACATDVAGNPPGCATPLRINADRQPPTTIANVTGIGAEGEFAPGAIVSLDPSDAISGVASTQARVNGAPATSPLTLSTPGSYQIEYWSVDVAGNVEVPHKNLSIRVDALSVGFALPAAARALERVSGSAIVGSVPAHVDVTIAGEDGSTISLASPVQDGQWNVTLPSALADGSYTVSAVVSDDAGRSSSPLARTIIIDTTAPTTSPSSIAGEGWLGAPIDITFTCSDGATPPTRAGCASTLVDGAVWDGAPIHLAFNGARTIRYQSTDAAGNVEAERSLTLQMDLTAPAVAIDPVAPSTRSLDAGGAVTLGPSGALALTLTRAADGASIAVPAAVASGRWNATLPAIAPGRYTLDAVASNAVGGRSVASATFTYDPIAPDATLTGPTAPTNVAPFVLAASYSDALSPVSATLASRFAPFGGAFGAWSSAPIVAPGSVSFAPAAGEGRYELVLRATDAAGNVNETPALLVTYDATPPRVSLMAPPLTNATEVPLTFAYDDATPLASSALLWRFAPPGGAFGAWTTAPLAATFAPGAGDGRYEIVATATDAAGNNAQSATAAFTLDRIAPTLALTSPSSTLATATSYVLTFAASDALAIASQDARVTRDDGASFNATASGLSVPIVPSTRSLSYAIHATDAAGNVATLVGSVRVIDPTAPSATVVLSGTAGTAGWFVSDVGATLRASASDATTSARQYVEGSAPGDFADATQVAIQGTGVHDLDVRATAVRDGTLLVGDLPAIRVPIDLDAPSVALALPSASVAEGQRVELRATASDAGSGVASVVAALTRNGGAPQTIALAPDANGWTASIGPFLATDDVRVSLRATDVAGLSTATDPVALRVVDATPPLVSILSPFGRVSGPASIAATASDASGTPSIAITLDGAPIAQGAWDTTSATNGPHAIVATATDASGNSASDAVTVVVDNAPAIGAIVFSPASAEEPSPATERVTASATVASAGSRALTATLFYRIAGASGFTSAPMTIAAGVGSAAIPGPFHARDVIEAYVVAADGASTSRSPSTGVATLAVKIPPTAPLATWIGSASTTFGPSASDDVPEGYADITDAGVLRGAEWTTFALHIRGPFLYSHAARYYVDLSNGFSFNASYDASGVWALRADEAGVTRDLAPDGLDLNIGNNEVDIRVRNDVLDALLGGSLADLQVGFRTVGSGDRTVFAPLDLLPPAIGAVALVDGARHTALHVSVAATDNVGPLNVRVVASTPDGAVAVAPVVAGIATLPAFDADHVDVLVIATDAAGNRAERSVRLALADVAAPVARVTLVGGSLDVAQGQPVALSGETSTDDVGIASYAWDTNGDGIADATARRVSVAFADAGDHVITLRVADAAGNSGLASITARVADITPPALALVAPAPGTYLGGGLVDIAIASADAVSVDAILDGATVLPAARALDGAWRVQWGAAEGPHVLSARARDAAGNVAALGAPATFVVDATPPVVRGLPASLRVIGAAATSIDATLDDATGIASAVWTWGDGSTESCASPCPTTLAMTHVYATFGTFEAQLRVVDLAGNVAIVSLPVVVAPPPSSAPDPAPRPVSPPPAKPATPTSPAANTTPPTTPPSAPAPTPAPTPTPTLTLTPTPTTPPPSPSAPPPPILPDVLAQAASGTLASPATVSFAAPSDAVVYWRLAGQNDWTPTSQGSASVAGDGSVRVEYYALNASGRSATHEITLDLDGLAPILSNVSARAEGGLARVHVAVEESHLATIEARITSARSNGTRVVTLTRDATGFGADVRDLALGTYDVSFRAVDDLGRETTAGPVHVTVGAGAPLESNGVPAAAKTPGAGLLGLVGAAAAAALVLARRRRA